MKYQFLPSAPLSVCLNPVGLLNIWIVNNSNLSLTVLEAETSKIKVMADLVPAEGFLLGLLRSGRE
jgi:hypothetical protein